MRGLTLFEVLVAMFLMLLVTSVVSNTFQMYSSGSRLATQHQAYLDTMIGLENVRNEVKEACRITSPGIGTSGAFALEFTRIDPSVAGRLPTINPLPVGPLPVPYAWDPLDAYYMATIRYQTGGAPVQLRRTSSGYFAPYLTVPVTGDFVSGFAVDHPSAGSMSLRVSLQYNGSLRQINLPIVVDCEL